MVVNPERHKRMARVIINTNRAQVQHKRPVRPSRWPMVSTEVVDPKIVGRRQPYCRIFCNRIERVAPMATTTPFRDRHKWPQLRRRHRCRHHRPILGSVTSTRTTVQMMNNNTNRWVNTDTSMALNDKHVSPLMSLQFRAIYLQTRLQTIYLKNALLLIINDSNRKQIRYSNELLFRKSISIEVKSFQISVNILNFIKQKKNRKWT